MRKLQRFDIVETIQDARTYEMYTIKQGTKCMVAEDEKDTWIKVKVGLDYYLINRALLRLV